MRIRPATPWAETVLHVLAHVNVGSVAASCHSPAWIAWAEERLGPAGERLLAEDARTLAQVARTHEVLARAHAVIWLFDDDKDASAVASRDLAELADADVKRPLALRLARDAGHAAEVLRVAAELELAPMATLPPLTIVPDVEGALERVAVAAPRLRELEVAIARPLGLRGRVFERTILVGAPGIGGADAEHVAWQAAHEATVDEVLDRGEARGHDAIERAAIARLRSRARAAGLDAEHARWLARFDLSALGPIPDVTDGT